MAEGRFTSILGIGPNIPRRKRRLKCGMRDKLKGNWWFRSVELVYVFGRKLDPNAFDLSGFPIESS